MLPVSQRKNGHFIYFCLDNHINLPVEQKLSGDWHQLNVWGLLSLFLLRGALADLTQSNARRFHSSFGSLLGRRGYKTECVLDKPRSKQFSFWPICSFQGFSLSKQRREGRREEKNDLLTRSSSPLVMAPVV